MPRSSTAFRIDDLAPTHSLSWQVAHPDQRRKFWQQVVVLVKEAKEKELVEGRDRFGKKLIPISRYTRAHRHSEMGVANYAAPPLTPADDKSRTNAYFDGRGHADHAEFFWRSGWGRILHYHRVGARNKWAKSGRLPVRDVIGLSPKSHKWVKGKAWAWWDATGKTPQRPPAATRSGAYQPIPTPLAARSLVFQPDDRAKRGRHPTVMADVRALDLAWQGDTGFHIPPGGGSDPQKYQNALAFVRKAMASGKPVTQPIVSVDKDGVVSFTDGRHRFAALRDLGVKRVPVSVDRGQTARAREWFGRTKTTGKAKPAARAEAPPPRKPPPSPLLKVVVQPELKPLTRAVSSFGEVAPPKLKVKDAPKPPGFFRKAAGKVKGWFGKLKGALFGGNVASP